MERRAHLRLMDSCINLRLTARFPNFASSNWSHLMSESDTRSNEIPNHFTEMCSGSEAGSYLRLIDSCITQREAQGPSRTCNESKEEENTGVRVRTRGTKLAVPTLININLNRVKKRRTCGDGCRHLFENNSFTEMCSGSEEGSYLRLIDFCITQLKACA